MRAFIAQNEDSCNKEIFKRLSLHREGRAIDITIGTKDEDGKVTTIYYDADIKEKLIELASLARKMVGFNYAEIKKHHVHLSTTK